MAWALRASIRCGLSQTQSNPSHALRPSVSIPDTNGTSPVMTRTKELLAR
jgi:hypothetical protein